MLQVMKDCEHIQKLANTIFYSYTQLFTKKSVQLKIQKTKTCQKNGHSGPEEQTTYHSNSHLLQYV